MNKRSARLLGVVLGLGALTAAWYGFVRMRSGDAPATPSSSSAALASASAPPPPPVDPRFSPRQKVRERPTTLLVPPPFLAFAASDEELFYVTTKDDKATFHARRLVGNAERSVAEIPLPAGTTISGLTVLEKALVWAEHAPADAPGTARIVTMGIDGKKRRDLRPAAACGALVRGGKSGEEIIVAHGGDVYAIDAELTPRTIASHVTADAVVADGEDVYWTTHDTLWHTPRGGAGAPEVLLKAPPETEIDVRGIIDSALFYTAGQSLFTREHGKTASSSIEGNARGRLLAEHVINGDLYVLVARPISATESQNLVMRVRHRAPRADAVVEADAISVAGATLYYAAKDGIRSTPR